MKQEIKDLKKRVFKTTDKLVQKNRILVEVYFKKVDKTKSGIILPDGIHKTAEGMLNLFHVLQSTSEIVSKGDVFEIEDYYFNVVENPQFSAYNDAPDSMKMGNAQPPQYLYVFQDRFKTDIKEFEQYPDRFFFVFNENVIRFIK